DSPKSSLVARGLARHSLTLHKTRNLNVLPSLTSVSQYPRSKFRSCCNHLRRPAFYDGAKAFKRPGEIASRGGKAQAEMRGRIEAIAGSQKDSTLGSGLAERACVLSAHQPGERGHTALGRNPAEHVAMLRHEAFKELKVPGSGFLGLAEHDVTFADGNFRKDLSGGGVGDREVGARVPVLPAALGVVLDHPARAHAGD